MNAEVYATARAAIGNGISVVPPAEDGSKALTTQWKLYQDKLPSESQINRWYRERGHTGIAFITGRVSGNLECFEFDDPDVYEQFKERAHQVDLGPLVERIEAGYAEATPGGGFHWFYRAPAITGSTRLARRPKRPDEQSNEHDRTKILIETRGEGGCAIAAPSNGRVHPTGKPYRLLTGGVDSIASITPDERQGLFDLARSFDQMPPQPRPEPKPTPAATGGLRPGDDFNQRAIWAEILEPHGWTHVHTRGEEGYWRKPGKAMGISATTNYQGSGLLYVFSTATSFEPERGYSPFGAYAHLNHGDDFDAAARDLALQGYGSPPPRLILTPTEPAPASAPTPAHSTPWPTLDPSALYGLAGEIVRALEPTTEADPVALLMTTLVMFGNAVGRTPHVMVGDDRHGANLFAVFVGDTAKARKGTSQSGPRRVVGKADPTWAAERVMGGLSTGEGLIWQIRDQIVRQNRKGEEEVVVDGVADKRLLAVEEEFSAVLKVAQRQGNTVSETIRRAWDSRDVLASMTKSSPARATNPHVSILAHITRDELVRTLCDTDTANGFGNRFLWSVVRRSKALPFPRRLDDPTVDSLAARVQEALKHGRQTATPYAFDETAAGLWSELYEELSAGQPGLYGALTARAEAQVIRLALIYAVLDQATAIGADHLTAALAVWDFCAASARFVFGDATGDSVADRILAALRSAERQSLSQTAISDLFGRNVSATRLLQALQTLVLAGRVFSKEQKQFDVDGNPTGGRPVTVWTAR